MLPQSEVSDHDQQEQGVEDHVYSEGQDMDEFDGRLAETDTCTQHLHFQGCVSLELDCWMVLEQAQEVEEHFHH